MQDRREERPFSHVLGEAVRQGSTLARLDIEILRAEVKGKALTLVASGAYGIAALAFFFLGAFALVEFLILAVVHLGVGALWAPLLIGGLLLLAGFGSLVLSQRAIKGMSILPDKTLHQMRSDFAALMKGARYGARDSGS